MIWKYYDARKFHGGGGGECKPMYNAIVFPVYAVLLAARRLLTAGFGTERAICHWALGSRMRQTQMRKHHQPWRGVPVPWSKRVNKD